MTCSEVNKCSPLNLRWHLDKGMNYLNRNPDEAGRPFFDVYFFDSLWMRGNTPTAIHSPWDFGDVGARFLKSFVNIRRVLERKEPFERERQLLDLLLKCQGDDGLIHRPHGAYFKPNPGQEEAHLWDQGQTLMAWAEAYAFGGDSRLPAALDRLVAGLDRAVTKDEDFAYFINEGFCGGRCMPPLTDSTVTMVLHTVSSGSGICIPGLVRIARYTGNQQALDLARRLARGTRKDRPYRIFGEDGSFTIYPGSATPMLRYIHVHSRTQTLLGLVELALLDHDRDLLDFAHRSLEWLLPQCMSFGWCPEHLPYCVGHYGEICTTVDVIEIMLLLARNGWPQYYNIAERFIRNHIVESQHVDCCSFENLLNLGINHAGHGEYASPGGAAGTKAPSADEQEALAKGYRYNNHVVERNLGGCEGAVWLDEHRGVFASGCCTPRMMDAFCFALLHAVTEHEDTLSINMLFNHDHPLAAVASHDPKEGLIEVRPRRAYACLRVRMPDWVKREDVSCQWPGRTDWEGPYLCVHDVHANEPVRITYPLREGEIPERFSNDLMQVTWRGDTVMSMRTDGPRIQQRQIPIYQRAWMLE